MWTVSHVYVTELWTLRLPGLVMPHTSCQPSALEVKDCPYNCLGEDN